MTSSIALDRRPPLSAVAITGVAYMASWIVGLALGHSDPKPSSSAAQVMAGYAGHTGTATAQFVLTEGLPAICLAVVALALGRRAAVAGLISATISMVQAMLGVVMTAWAVPGGHTGSAHNLFVAVNRLDGVKMFALALLALAATSLVPLWLRYVGAALAVSIVVSGIGYLLLLDGLSRAAWISGPLLLIWVTGTALTLGPRSRLR